MHLATNQTTKDIYVDSFPFTFVERMMTLRENKRLPQHGPRAGNFMKMVFAHVKGRETRSSATLCFLVFGCTQRTQSKCAQCLVRSKELGSFPKYITSTKTKLKKKMGLKKKVKKMGNFSGNRVFLKPS